MSVWIFLPPTVFVSEAKKVAVPSVIYGVSCLSVQGKICQSWSEQSHGLPLLMLSDILTPSLSLACRQSFWERNVEERLDLYVTFRDSLRLYKQV